MTIFAFKYIRTTLLNDIKHNQIQDLHLSGRGLSATDLCCILRELKQNYSIHNLNLSDCAIDRLAAINLNSVLQENQTIHTLLLNNCNLDTTNLNIIAKGIAKNSSLIRLELQNNNFRDNKQEFSRCIELIKNNTSLRRIDLSGNHLIKPSSLSRLNNGHLYELIFPDTQIGTKYTSAQPRAKL